MSNTIYIILCIFVLIAGTYIGYVAGMKAGYEECIKIIDKLFRKPQNQSEEEKERERIKNEWNKYT